MTKGLQRSLARAPVGRAPGARAPSPVKVTLVVAALALEVDGATGVGWGTVVAGDFPEGNIQLLGAVANLQFTGPTSASLDDDWEGDFGVGTTPASDATITGADVDIIPSTALAAATAEASPKTRAVMATPVIFDNTDGSLEINVNLLVDDANIGADDLAFTADGEIELSYTILGDD